MTRLAIIGSREFIRLDKVDEYIRSQRDLDCIVSGGARGVDSAGEQTAWDLSLPVVSFRPYSPGTGWVVDRVTCSRGSLPQHFILPGTYRSFGQAAYVRNGYIIEFADEVVAFWDGRSRGTEQVIQRAGGVDKLREVVRA